MQNASDPSPSEQQSAPDASLTEQQWRQRVEDARTRSAEFVEVVFDPPPELDMPQPATVRPAAKASRNESADLS